MKKNILLVTSQGLFREGLKRLLAGPSFAVAAESDDFEAAERLIAEGLEPDLVLIERETVTDHDVDAIDKLRSRNGPSAFVLLAKEVPAQTLARLLDSGIDACLMKDISQDALLKSLELVMAGESIFPVSLARALIGQNHRHCSRDASAIRDSGLSRREQEILGCLVEGDTNKTIAKRLDITEATVKVHLKTLLRKIKAGNRTQAALWAAYHGVEPYRTPTVRLRLPLPAKRAAAQASKAGARA